MIIAADEIYGSMQHSALDFAAKKPITHTLMMTISKEISKRKMKKQVNRLMHVKENSNSYVILVI